MQKKIVFFMVLMILFLTSFNSVKADNKNIFLGFFHSEGCSGCQSKEPIIDSIEQEYPDLEIIRYLVSSDEKSDNYTLLKKFYNFNYVPAVVITNQSSKIYSCINYRNISYYNLENVLDRYYSGIQNNDDKNINSSLIFLDYYYSNENTATKKQIDASNESYQDNRSIFFRNKKIDEYSWEYQKYSKQFQETYPFLVIKTLSSYTLIPEEELTLEKVGWVLVEQYHADINITTDVNQTKEDDKKDGGFIPGFEMALLVFALMLIFVFRRENYKKR